MSPVNSFLSQSFAVATTFPKIVTNGLVLHLDAGQQNSYNGGTTWRDLSGRGNNFSMTGTLSFSNGVFTSTASTANYFIRNPFTHPTTAATIEMWLLANSGSSGDALWSYAISTADNNNLLFDQTNLTLFAVGAAPTGVTSGINIADGQWRQIVRTSNRSTGAEILYVNGVSVFSTTMGAGTNFTSGGSLVLGQEQDSVGGSFDAAQALEGRYSVFRMYDRVLTESEVAQNFNALRGRYGI